MRRSKSLPGIMRWLGYGGLIPFFLMTLALLTHETLPFSEQFPVGWVLAAYTAIVLTFIGAMHWWVALDIQDGLAGNDLGKLLALSLVPTMIAWFSLLLPVNVALLILGVLIIVAYVADSVLLFDKIDAWYARMRLHLSIIVALLLFAAGVVVSA